MRYVKAVFERVDPGPVVRSSAGRIYSHAWQMQGRNGSGREYLSGGFSSSKTLAEAAAASAAPRGCRVLQFEVVPVVEITASEYRRARKEV